MPIRTVKYNPAFLSEEDLVRSFVVRHTDLELIVQVLRENVTDSNQHVLVTGPRGIGKTMLALRVAAEVRRTEELRRRWYPLVFAEESYEVSSPGEFWLEALFHLGEQTNDSRWKRTYETLRDEHGEHDEQRLRESALAQLMDFADAEGKRLLLVVENFGMLAGDQISDDDGWALRHTLLHEPRIMLLATAASRFEEIQTQGKAMFELFKPHKLHPLTEDECGAVWVSVAGDKPVDGRIRPIQILTGGNPRLVTIISSFAAQLSFKELLTDLMHLVDEHTEYFKSHLDNLAPTERKVYLGLADLWTPATARKVAGMVRLGVSKTSSLLARLARRGAVVVGEDTGRTKSYYVAERMYNIYYLMRRRAGESGRVRALVNFMVGFYPPQELIDVTARIAREACELEPERRREHVLAYEAILKDPAVQTMREDILSATPMGFFEGGDIPPSIRDLAKCRGWEQLKPQLYELLKEMDALLGQPDKLAEVEALCNKAIKVAPKEALPRVVLGMVCQGSGKYQQAEQAYRKGIELDADYGVVWGLVGHLLHTHLGQYDEAEVAYRKAIESFPKHASWAWTQIGDLRRDRLGRYAEAEEAYRIAIGLDEGYAPAWSGLGTLLWVHLDRRDEAERALRRALEVAPENRVNCVLLLAVLLDRADRLTEALKLAEDALLQHNRDPRVLAVLAWLFTERGGMAARERSEAWAREAATKEPQQTRNQEMLASVLCASGKQAKALEPARKVVEDASYVKDSADACVDLFVSLAAGGYAREALEILEDSPSAELLEPLIVGLRLFLDKKVNVAVEILEVGKDVLKRIQERQMKLSAERPRENQPVEE
ncbi:MAG: tetratricopeptide repeat protein [Phycisphaerales bacterium]|nr:MAG: tetratricopeptide repeat protein [Phycisphaerales bacterium]